MFFVVYLRVIMNMKRIILIYILVLLTGQASLYAQTPVQNNHTNEFNSDGFPTHPEENSENDTTKRIDAKTVPIAVRMWTVDQRLGNITLAPVDTIFHQFQNTNLTEGMNGHYNYLGNLGSPRISRIFFDRPDNTPFMFTDPYSAFIMQPSDIRYTNTKSPFTNLTYYKGGGKRTGEDRFKSYFSVNVNKRLGIGFSIDYLYGRGMYANQSTAFFNGNLFATYLGNHYNMHFLFSTNNLKMGENGGITDDRYITDPLGMSEGKKQYASENIPTNIENTWNYNKDYRFFLTHRYNLGFYKESKEQDNKKGKKEFVPVSSFIHTLNLQTNNRRYLANAADSASYLNTFLNKQATEDKTKHLLVKNTLGISLLEGFNKWAKAGLTAFASYEYRNYTLPDTLYERKRQFVNKYTENTLSVGGQLSKTQGKLLHYNITGEFAFAGTDIGQFNVDGKMDLNFRLFKDTVRLQAHAYIKNSNPSFYFRHFHSNHYWWDNDLSKELRTRIEGELTIDRWRTNLKAGVENIKNYTYFDNADINSPTGQGKFLNNVAVRQNSANIQVFSAILNQNFKFGIFRLDNEVTYQKSSNNTVLPLPDLSLYHNLYIDFTLAKKVVNIELGADVRYFTKYNAPDYSPGIGQYYLQNPEKMVEIGGYPIINIYANIHLKRTRIFVMMYHINEGMGNSNYFLAPHYPINPRMFKFGISWNFFD